MVSTPLNHNNQRAFTITIHNVIDEYRSFLDFSISYHFHNDYNATVKYKNLFYELFDAIGTLDDNLVSFDDEQGLVKGLQNFTKLL